MQLSNYNIISEIGQGGMATVYLAHDFKFDTNVAIKVLRKEFIQNENIRKRFLAEARNIFRMSHLNIIKVTDLIEENETVAFVMEYVDGETLKDYIERKGKLSEFEINGLFTQILNAVDYVHKQLLVHRDIKPSNIMIAKDLQVKLMDFGIAKTSDASSNEYTQTGTGVQMGTPIYMSPEQITETKAVTVKSDIYSLGVVLWQMVTGQKPYNTNTLSTFQLQTKIVNEDLPKTYSIFDDIIQKATYKNPDIRYKDIQAFKDAMKSSVKKKKDDETVIDTKKKLDESISNKKSYKKLLKWSTSIVIIVSICISGYFYSKSDQYNQDKYYIGCIKDKLGAYKYGFIDTEGNWVIQPTFDGVDDFKEGLAVASINGKYGCIDKKGNWVIQPILDGVDDFEEGIAIARINNKYGCIDTGGKWIVQPICLHLGSYHEGLAIVVINSFDKCGFIDTKGNWVIQPTFSSVGQYSEGLASAIINDKCGFIDTKGNWVIQPAFDYVGKFDEGLAPAMVNNKVGFIDTKGNWIIQPAFETVRGFKQGLALAKINGKCGYINKKGDWEIKPIFDGIDYFSDGFARVKLNRKLGIIDLKGKWIVQPICDWVGKFHDGLNLISINRTYGYIDEKGKWILPPIFDDASYFIKGIAVASINGKYGFIDKKGNWVNKLSFDWVDDDYTPEELIRAGKNGKYGYIDMKGNWVIEPIFDIQSFESVRVDSTGINTSNFHYNYIDATIKSNNDYTFY
jgi:serine/threonine protein kinase